MMYAQYIHHSCRSKRAKVSVSSREKRVLFVVWPHCMQPQFALEDATVLVRDIRGTLYFTNLWINISEFESPSSHQLNGHCWYQGYSFMHTYRVFGIIGINKTISFNQKLTPFPVRDNFSLISSSPKALQKVFIFVGWTTFGNSLLCVSTQKEKREKKFRR